MCGAQGLLVTTRGGGRLRPRLQFVDLPLQCLCHQLMLLRHMASVLRLFLGKFRRTPHHVTLMPQALQLRLGGRLASNGFLRRLASILLARRGLLNLALQVLHLQCRVLVLPLQLFHALLHGIHQLTHAYRSLLMRCLGLTQCVHLRFARFLRLHCLPRLLARFLHLLRQCRPIGSERVHIVFQGLHHLAVRGGRGAQAASILLCGCQLCTKLCDDLTLAGFQCHQLHLVRVAQVIHLFGRGQDDIRCRCIDCFASCASCTSCASCYVLSQVHHHGDQFILLALLQRLEGSRCRVAAAAAPVRPRRANGDIGRKLNTDCSLVCSCLRSRTWLPLPP